MVDRNNTEDLQLEYGFQNISNGDALICILPPNGGDNWPFRDQYSAGGLSRVGKIGVALGAFFAVCLIAIVSYLIRNANLKRRQQGKGEIIKFIPIP